MRWLSSIIICLLLCGCHRHITEQSHTADTLYISDTCWVERVLEVYKVSYDTIREEVRTTLVLGADSSVLHSTTERSTYVSRNNDSASNNTTTERTASKRVETHQDTKVQVVEVEQPLSSLQRTIMGIGWLAIVMVVLCAGFYFLVFRRRH